MTMTMDHNQIATKRIPVVLIVDDSPDVHRLLHARLRHEELELVSAHSGNEGIEKAKELSPSLILLDLDMPEIDGFETLRILKDSDETVGVPVVVLSGLQSSGDKVTAFDLGAVDYITKPFDLMELRVRVRAAVRMNELIQLLAQRAQIDGLTGLYNRQHFDDRWAVAASLNKRHGTPVALAMFDLDHFKSLNDSFGHPAGDHALRVFAELLQRECRSSDVPCRYGGEEFALIMPETSPDDAGKLCERIGAALRAMHWPSHPERTITVSIGVAGASQTADVAASAWIGEADKALYAAKQGGRDQVKVKVLDGAGPKMAQAG